MAQVATGDGQHAHLVDFFHCEGVSSRHASGMTLRWRLLSERHVSCGAGRVLLPRRRTTLSIAHCTQLVETLHREGVSRRVSRRHDLQCRILTASARHGPTLPAAVESSVARRVTRRFALAVILQFSPPLLCAAAAFVRHPRVSWRAHDLPPTRAGRVRSWTHRHPRGPPRRGAPEVLEQSCPRTSAELFLK